MPKRVIYLDEETAPAAEGWDNLSALVRYLLGQTNEQYRRAKLEILEAIILTRDDVLAVITVCNGHFWTDGMDAGEEIAANVEDAIALGELDHLTLSDDLPDLCRQHGDALRIVSDLYWQGEQRSLDWLN